MTHLIDYQTVQPYITKDGSLIRELVHPSVIAGANQSLAEATIPPGGKTMLHQHRTCQEIYHITAGSGTSIWVQPCRMNGGGRALDGLGVPPDYQTQPNSECRHVYCRS